MSLSFQIFNLLVNQTKIFTWSSVLFRFPLAYVKYHILLDVSPSKEKNDNNWSFDFDEVTSWKKPPTSLLVLLALSSLRLKVSVQ